MRDVYNWKNFKLGTELQVAGSFIYNALNVFQRMNSLHYEEECFEFLYNAAIGFERLEKILLILIEEVEPEKQDDFEASLKTHNHVDLLARIRKIHPVKLPKLHVQFLSMLTDFYAKTRYSRFKLLSVYEDDQDKYRLKKFIEDELKIKLVDHILMAARLAPSMKLFIARIIGRISEELYEAITEVARRHNMYTYELASDSKAYKIFMCKEYTFEKEYLLKRELITFLLHLDSTDGLIRLVKEINPLPFENNNTDDIIKTLVYDRIDRGFIDEMEYIYEENPFDKERFEAINIIGEGNYFGDVDETE